MGEAIERKREREGERKRETERETLMSFKKLLGHTA